MTNRDERLLHNLLGPLSMHFLAARGAYEDYLADGKSFLFACSLRRRNLSARALLLEHGFLLPEEHKGDAVALIRHWDVWLTLWEDLERRTSPRPQDPFAFDNAVTYPVDAQARLEALHARLAGELQRAAGEC